MSRNTFVAATLTVLMTATPAFAFDLSDNPINHAAGFLNNILTGVNNGLEQGLLKFDKAALMVKVDGSADAYRLEALNGTRRQYRVTPDELEYVFHAGLAAAATKACGGRDYAFNESSPQAIQAWNKYLAEQTPLDTSNQQQMALIWAPTAEYSIVWQVQCGQPGSWAYPGERALSLPLSKYTAILEPGFRRMSPLQAQGRSVTLRVPSGELLRTSYGYDLRTKEGHLGLFRQRLMNAAVVARLQQSGAQVQVHEFDNLSEVAKQDGVYIMPKPTALSLVASGSVTETWNPLKQWDQLMSRSIRSYGDEMLAFGDAGATFAVKAGPTAADKRRTEAVD